MGCRSRVASSRCIRAQFDSGRGTREGGADGHSAASSAPSSKSSDSGHDIPASRAPPEVAAGRAVGNPQNGSDLPVAPAKAVLQPEYISSLAHWTTSSGPPFFLRAQGSLARLEERPPDQVIQHPSQAARLRHAGVAGAPHRGRTKVDDMRRNRWTAFDVLTGLGLCLLGTP